MKGRRLFLGLVRHFSKAGSIRVYYFKYDCLVSTDQLEMKELNINPIQMKSTDDTTVLLQHIKQQTAINNNTDQETVIVAVDSLTPLLLKSSTAIVLAAIKNITQIGRLGNILQQINSCKFL